MTMLVFKFGYELYEIVPFSIVLVHTHMHFLVCAQEDKWSLI